MRERIGTAQHASDLGEVLLEEIGNVDIVRACGMAGYSNPLGLSIWRWRVGGDQREVFAVARGLIEKRYDPKLVHRVLAHLADDICDACDGRGYELMEGAPVLSDSLCVVCAGTGRKPLKGEAEKALVEVIAGLEREFAAAVMRRLAKDLEDFKSFG